MHIGKVSQSWSFLLFFLFLYKSVFIYYFPGIFIWLKNCPNSIPPLHRVKSVQNMLWSYNGICFRERQTIAHAHDWSVDTLRQAWWKRMAERFLEIYAVLWSHKPCIRIFTEHMCVFSCVKTTGWSGWKILTAPNVNLTAGWLMDN